MNHKAWLNDTPYNQLERNLKRLGKSMLGGVIYDLLLAAICLAFPGQIARVMGLSAPYDLFCFYFLPLVHLLLPCFCILAWMDTKRNVVIVTGAIAARVLYAAFMFASVLFLHVHPAWAILGAISMLLAAIHYWLLRISDFGFWEVFSRAGNPPGMRRR